MGIRKIDEIHCNGCGICIEICPLDVLRMDQDRGIAFVKYLEDCMSCCLCELECPADAITVTPLRERRTPLAW
jgi:NAD-dependent dihydropyrimidine dehydrogenase PreA subunit